MSQGNCLESRLQHHAVYKIVTPSNSYADNAQNKNTLPIIAPYPTPKFYTMFPVLRTNNFVNVNYNLITFIGVYALVGRGSRVLFLQRWGDGFCHSLHREAKSVQLMVSLYDIPCFGVYLRVSRRYGANPFRVHTAA